MKKKLKFNILQFFLRLPPSNCESVLTLRKSGKQNKKKGYAFRVCFP